MLAMQCGTISGQLRYYIHYTVLQTAYLGGGADCGMLTARAERHTPRPPGRQLQTLLLTALSTANTVLWMCLCLRRMLYATVDHTIPAAMSRLLLTTNECILCVAARMIQCISLDSAILALL